MIARWLNAFYDSVERDELLAPVFGGAVTREHRGLASSAEQRLRFVTLLSRAADEVDLPADPECPCRAYGVGRVGHAAGGRELRAGRNSHQARPVPKWAGPSYRP